MNDDTTKEINAQMRANVRNLLGKIINEFQDDRESESQIHTELYMDAYRALLKAYGSILTLKA